MGSILIDIKDNEILRDVWEEVMAKGEAKGEAKGKAEGEAAGMVRILRGQLLIKFGRVPKWAEERLAKANTAQIERWAKKLMTAETLEGVVGRK